MTTEEMKAKAKANIDTKFVVSGLVLAVLIGLTIFGLKKAGFNTAAQIVKGGA